MSLEVIETPEAVNDVIEAADYIAARSSLNASDKFLESVKSTYRQIADMPGMGVARDFGQPDLKGMRMWRVPKYPRFLVFYVTTGRELIILHVLNVSQDLDAIFRAPG